MTRYFTYKKPSIFWEKLKIAFWAVKGGEVLEYQKDGTSKKSRQTIGSLTNSQSIAPEIDYSSAAALLDEPWKLVEDGWRVLGDGEKPTKGDEYYRVGTNVWKKSIFWGRKTVAEILEDSTEIKAYRRKISVNNNNNKGEKTVSNNNKFKVGDKVRIPKGSFYADTPWAIGTMTVVRERGNDMFSCEHSNLSVGCFEAKEIELVPALPTQFQVDTRGLEGVQATLIKLHMEKYPKCTWCQTVGSHKHFFVWGLNKPDSLDYNPTAYNVEQFPHISLDEAITILTTKPEPKVREVKLNDAYTAVVTQGKDTVKVGCQEIPLTAVEALWKACGEVGK